MLCSFRSICSYPVGLSFRYGQSPWPFLCYSLLLDSCSSSHSFSTCWSLWRWWCSGDPSRSILCLFWDPLWRYFCTLYSPSFTLDIPIPISVLMASFLHLIGGEVPDKIDVIYDIYNGYKSFFFSLWLLERKAKNIWAMRTINISFVYFFFLPLTLC